MTKDFEALALERSDEHRKGLRPFQMYDSNDMNAAFLAGARYGREAGLDLAAGIAESRCSMSHDFWTASRQGASRVIAQTIRAAKGNT